MTTALYRNLPLVLLVKLKFAKFIIFAIMCFFARCRAHCSYYAQPGVPSGGYWPGATCLPVAGPVAETRGRVRAVDRWSVEHDVFYSYRHCLLLIRHNLPVNTR